MESAMNIGVGLSPQAIDLLKIGSMHVHGNPLQGIRIRKPHEAALAELTQRGFIRWICNLDPMVTDAGRAAVDAPSEIEAARIRASSQSAARLERGKTAPQANEKSKPTGRHDTVYKMYRQMKVISFLVVKHSDKENSIEVSRDGGPEGHIYLGSKYLIVEPESSGRFIVATYPRWIVNKIGLGDASRRGINLLGVTPALSEDAEWTPEEQKLWTHLHRVPSSINSQIRNSNIRTPKYSGGRRSSFSPW